MSPNPLPRRARRTAVTAALTLALTVLMAFAATIASAGETGRRTVRTSSTMCMQANSEFTWNTGAGGGFAVKQARVEVFARTPDCAHTLVVPDGKMRVRLDLYYKAQDGSWKRCEKGEWAYGGGGDTHSGDIVYEQSASASQVYSTPPCGPAIYLTRALPRVWNGSVWEGEAENITLDSPAMQAG